MRALQCALALIAALALASKGIGATVGISSLSFLVGPEMKLRYPDTIPSALSRNTSQRVAIIGGGAAGLTAAATLQQLGYKNVVVFEADPKVGGKCLSVEIDGEFYDLGAIQISSAYKMVPALAAATKTPFYRYSAVPKSEFFTAPATAQAPSNSSGSSSGSSATGSNSTGLSAVAEVAELLAGVGALAATSKRYYRELSAPGMLQASESASLAGATFSAFAAANRFGAPLTRLLSDAMTGFGYSYNTLTSAAFWMRLAADLGLVTGELEVLTPTFKKYGLGILTFERGFQSLWLDVAKEIGSSSPGAAGKSPPVDIRTGTRVVGVARTNASAGGVQVSFSSNSTVVATETFDRLIVTAPLQTAQTFMQLTPQESALFGQIKTVRYLVTVAEPPAGYDTSTASPGRLFPQNMVPARVNHPVALAQQHRASSGGPGPRRNLRTFYQILDDAITTAAATDVLRQDAAELTGVPLGQIRAQRNWEGDAAYFPHLSSESMGAGWYKDVEATQGQRGTFWAGSVMSFEDVERTSVYANYLALRWF